MLYRITAPRRAEPAYGLWCMVDTDQISTSADEPGLVIRNEDVFIAKVRERVALAEAVGHLLSPVLLLQTGRGDELHAALAAAADAAGAPAATDTRPGRAHPRDLAARPPGPAQDELVALAGGGELVVADGNHRSLAAQTGGLPRFLAVVTTPALGRHPALQPAGQRADRSRRTSCSTRLDRGRRDGRAELPRPAAVPAPAARSQLYAAGRSYAVTLPPDAGAAGRGQPGPRAGRAGAAAATRWAWTRATSGSPTSAATTRPSGCAARSTPAAPSWPC